MNSSLSRADAGTHLRIVATALVAASVVVWIGIAARISPAPLAKRIDVPAKPTTVPIQPSNVPMRPSVTAMAESQRF